MLTHLVGHAASPSRQVQWVLFAVNALIHVSTTYPDAGGYQDTCREAKYHEKGSWMYGTITTSYCNDMMCKACSIHQHKSLKTRASQYDVHFIDAHVSLCSLTLLRTQGAATRRTHWSDATGSHTIAAL